MNNDNKCFRISVTDPSGNEIAQVSMVEKFANLECNWQRAFKRLIQEVEEKIFLKKVKTKTFLK